MVIFKMLNGKTIEVDRFMQGPEIPGNHWYKPTDDSVYLEVLGTLRTVDPNINYLFGYEEKSFLDMQYK